MFAFIVAIWVTWLLARTYKISSADTVLSDPFAFLAKLKAKK